jgi:hypothetical protein
MKRRKKRREPAKKKEEISATEIARSAGLPKEIILRVIEDGTLTAYTVGNGDIWFEPTFRDAVRHAIIGTAYHLEFLATEKLPELSWNWGPVLPPRRENPAP